MRENNHAHSTATSVHNNKLTVSTKHFWRKKRIARQKSTLWIKLAMTIKFWHTWRLLRLNPGEQEEHLTHQPAFTAFALSTKFSRWVSLGAQHPIMLIMVLLTFRLVKGEIFMTLYFEVGASNVKSCMWWFWIVVTTRFLCFLKLFRGMWEGGGPLKWHVPVWGIFVGRFRCGKMGWPLKDESLNKKFCGTLHVWRSDRNC